EIFRGITEARLVSTHDFTEVEDRARLARSASLPVLSSLSTSSRMHAPAEVSALPRTSIVIPVTLVSTCVLLEFARAYWGTPLDVRLLGMASAAPMFALLEQQSPDLAVVPRASVESLTERGVRRHYVPLTTLGRGSHGMIIPAAFSPALHDVSTKKIDML